MRRKSYFNGILTVNAVLLAGLLWMQVAGEASLTPAAQAQVRSRPNPLVIPPNASSQRFQMITEITKLSQTVEALKNQLESGSIKVEVTNFDQFGK